ncbi:MAG: hypothetical protein AB1542_04170 [Pseudomonadota bacterium]
MIKVIDCPVRALTGGPEAHFFGYFDKSPWSDDRAETRILSHAISCDTRMPEPGEEVQLGVVADKAPFVTVAKSRAWNLQQGAMLQWLKQYPGEILFNDIRDGRAVSVRKDLRSDKETLYDRPVGIVSPCGLRALSINFGRLSALKPEYGYAGLVDDFAGQEVPADDGIFDLDLRSGASRLLISLKAITETGEDGLGEGAVHYINHPIFNRSGSRFSFVHRYIYPSGTQHTRMLSARADGSDLRLLISGMASHSGWRNDHELLAWAGERKLLRQATAGAGGKLPIGSMLKKVYRLLGKPAIFKTAVMNDRYIVFDLESGEQRTVVKGVLRTDGHCSFSSDGRWFVTDTYPDAKGLAKLYIVHWDTSTVFQIAKLRSPPELDNEIRCDMHPRWHPALPLICIDSAHSGVRQMYEIDVSKIVQSL